MQSHIRDFSLEDMSFDVSHEGQHLYVIPIAIKCKDWNCASATIHEWGNEKGRRALTLFVVEVQCTMHGGTDASRRACLQHSQR